jgi:hypothetical protein
MPDETKLDRRLVPRVGSAAVLKIIAIGLIESERSAIDCGDALQIILHREAKANSTLRGSDFNATAPHQPGIFALAKAAHHK